MKFALGTKINMSQVWNDSGVVVPVTLLSVSPMTVIQVKTKEKDGYFAVQFGSGTRKEKNLTKAEKGHMKSLGSFRYVREWRPLPELAGELKIGDSLLLENIFQAGDKISVSGITKGKGFQGVVKRHGFAGGPRTHGQKHSEREPGAIGGGGRAGARVPKGMRMAGRMGGDRVTVKNLKVVAVIPQDGILAVSGAIPGRRGTLLEIHG